MSARVTISVTILFAAYYLVPTKGTGEDSDLPWLILDLLIFGVVVAIQVPAIIKAKYPKLRAIEALAVTVPLFLLIFSRIYLSNSLTDPAVFTLPLDHTTALYFTVTVFATVGFGDIVAQTNGMRLLVTLQMLLDLAVPYRYLEVHGHARIEPDHDYAFADKVGAKYGGSDLRKMDQPGEKRVVVTIEPTRVYAPALG